MSEKHFLGIDLGGTNIKTGVVDNEAKVISKFSMPTLAEDGGPAGVLMRMCQAGEEAIKQAGLTIDDIHAIGVGAPGALSHKDGIIIAPPNLPGWKNVPVRDAISVYFGGKFTTLENDANAAAWGEYWAGVGKGTDSLVMLTLGTGVGGGIIHGNRFVRGFHNVAAELGHMVVEPGGRLCNCGQHGCLEIYASATNTAKIAVEKIAGGTVSSMKRVIEAGKPINTEVIVEHMLNGDQFAYDLWHETCRYIAIGCLNLNHTFNPEVIALAGGMVNAGVQLLNPVRMYYKELQGHVFGGFCSEIVLAKLGSDAGLVGAAGAAKLTLEQGDW